MASNKKTLAQQAAERDAGKTELGQREGDHVFMYQERAEREGFRNVSKPWYEKCLPADQVQAALEQEAQTCMDLEVPPSAIVLAEDASLTIEGERLTLTNHAAGALCQWAKLPAGTAGALLNEGDAEGKELFARAINRGLGLHHPERERGFKLRLRGTEVRAFVSDSFAAIDNLWAFELLNNIVPGALVSHFRHDGDSMSGLLIIPDSIREEKDSDYGGGIHFRNSEIGKARLVTRPSVFRSICMNGCIWGELSADATVQRKHRGEPDLKDIAERVYMSIQDSIPLSIRCIDDMLATGAIDLHDKLVCVKLMARASKGITQESRKDWVAGWIEEGQHTTAFGVIQGLTRAGRDAKPMDEALSLESFAGDLVSKSSDWWNREAEYAGNSMTEDELLQLLGAPLLAEALA